MADLKDLQATCEYDEAGAAAAMQKLAELAALRRVPTAEGAVRRRRSPPRDGHA